MLLQASVDTMLKTAVQSQLDRVRTGLNQLQSALQDVYEIKQRYIHIYISPPPPYKTIPSSMKKWTYKKDGPSRERDK
jgi:hypothetical protein